MQHRERRYVPFLDELESRPLFPETSSGGAASASSDSASCIIRHKPRSSCDLYHVLIQQSPLEVFEDVVADGDERRNSEDTILDQVRDSRQRLLFVRAAEGTRYPPRVAH